MNKMNQILIGRINDYVSQINMIQKSINDNHITLLAASKEVSILTANVISMVSKEASRIKDRIILRQMKREFRKLIFDSVIKKSLLMKRALEKPRGYPGDYKIIEHIYNNKPISSSIGYCLDQLFLNDGYAFAIRSRKDAMKAMLCDFIKKSKLDTINILNLACGSCREIREFLLSSPNLSNKNLIFTLVDQDEKALEFSEKEIRKNNIANVRFKYVKSDILDFLKNIDKYNLPEQNLIYSIGLLDYLPDVVLRPVLSHAHDFLEKKGQLIIAHKDVKKYKPVPSDWMCDWGNFYIRDVSYVVNLIKSLPGMDMSIKIKRDQTKLIFFLTLNS
jgi:hypothetical protein